MTANVLPNPPAAICPGSCATRDWSAILRSVPIRSGAAKVTVLAGGVGDGALVVGADVVAPSVGVGVEPAVDAGFLSPRNTKIAVAVRSAGTRPWASRWAGTRGARSRRGCTRAGSRRGCPGRPADTPGATPPAGTRAVVTRPAGTRPGCPDRPAGTRPGCPDRPAGTPVEVTRAGAGSSRARPAAGRTDRTSWTS